MASLNSLVTDTGLRLAYLSGVAQVAERMRGGAGVILKFEHIRPPSGGAFRPLRSRDTSPEFLDKAISAIKRWRYDFLNMEGVMARATQPASAQRFVSLTFEGAHRDFMTFAYPVLARHRVPFTLFVPTGFVDGIGEAWWLALEQIIARHQRIGLMMDNVENRFATGTTEEKHQVYSYLYDWLRNLSPAERTGAIGDLSTRYGGELEAVSRSDAMNWADLAKLAQDPRVTVGSATVNYPTLSAAKTETVLREMSMGRSVLESALGIQCRHIAYPFGDDRSFGAREIQLAQQSGFVTAVSAQPGVVFAGGKSNLLSLPRVTWDGRRTSIALLRAILSGLALPRQRPA